MKLNKILSLLNSLEKNSFLKVIDNIISENPQNKIEINKILLSHDGQLKNTDDNNVTKIFKLIEKEFSQNIAYEFANTSSQLDILIDILVRDGNCIMSREWFLKLYQNEVKSLKKKIISFKPNLTSDKSEADIERRKDYKIYFKCLHTAYFNDEENNQEPKITSDELSILSTLANELGLSQEEIRLINYSVLPLELIEIEDLINDLKSIGLIFYQKKSHTIYVADEIVSLLRRFRGKEIADKHYYRVLSHLKDSQLNLIARKHGIDYKLDRTGKIKSIIKNGINFSTLMSEEIYKSGTTQTEIKDFLNTLIFKELRIDSENKGKTAEEKIEIIKEHFDQIDKEQKLGISYHGYDKLLRDLNRVLPKLNSVLKKEYELQNEFVLKSDFLLDYNILPRDVLYLLEASELDKFCKEFEIKTRGNNIQNILDQYKDTENLFIENYDLIAFRNYNQLKENDIDLKEAELGLKFEDLTKAIFTKIGFNVDEKLRKNLNTAKNKIDIVINLGSNELIIVECKTSKESGYNKYSSVSRQIKSYINIAEKAGYRVVKSLLVAPEFSDEFEKECGLEYELNLSLISATSLKFIYHGFLNSSLKIFPYKLLLRDVLIKEDRILKAMTK